MYLILFDTNKTNKNIDMEEKAKTVNMSGIDLNLDTYYDEEEQENVRHIQCEWDYIDKYFFSVTLEEHEDEEQQAFIENWRELLRD